MTDSEPCPYCGSTKRRKYYNKWHIRELYCGECHRCLNQDQVREQTRLAEKASKEGKIDDFFMGKYKPNGQ